MKYIVILLIILSYVFSLKMINRSHKINNPFEKFSLEQKFVNQPLKLINEEIDVTNFAAIYKINDDFYLTNTENNLNNKNIVAKAFFQKTLFQKGWDKLSITTFNNSDPFSQTYAAGYLEARLTSNDIFDFYYNLKENTKCIYNTKIANSDFEKMKIFLNEVGRNMENRFRNIKDLTEGDIPFWSNILLGFVQLKGLEHGYKFHVKKNNVPDKYLSLGELLILQADGEVPELLRFFNYINKSQIVRGSLRLGSPNYFREAFNIDTKDPKLFWARLMWHSKCSAMIKLIKDENGNHKDILSGHTTWTDYYEMIRTYKHYNFELDGPKSNLFKNSEITFSSYPGCLSSTDDFYLTNNKLLITETTLEVVDIKQYDNVKKEDTYIPNFLRVMAATRVSQSAEEWINNFKHYNSGTYSSQWMVVDYNVFNKIKGTKQRQDKLLYILEQTPNKMVSYDISQQFYDQGYFASFNRAFFQETKIDLNQALITSLYGNIFDYEGANRKTIFNKLQNKVNDLKSLKDLLRYNAYKMQNNEFVDDPSRDNPGSGISARYDLGPYSNLSGGIDCKITNLEMINRLESVAISGPTFDNNPNLSPFSWNQISSGIIHKGNAETYNFPWILTSPKNLCCNNNDVYEWNSK